VMVRTPLKLPILALVAIAACVAAGVTVTTAVDVYHDVWSASGQ